MRTREIVQHAGESALDLAKAIKGFYPAIAEAVAQGDRQAEALARNGAKHWAMTLAETYSMHEIENALRVNRIHMKDFEAILERAYVK